MPITVDRETSKPTPGTQPGLSGRWLVDPQASHEWVALAGHVRREACRFGL